MCERERVREPRVSNAQKSFQSVSSIEGERENKRKREKERERENETRGVKDVF